MELKDKKIIEIIENKGATLDYDYNNFNSNMGFMVSLKGQEVKIDKNDIQGIKREVEEKRKFIQNRRKLFIGLWLENDILYIDVSIHIIDYLKALEVARKNDQKAIYDLQKNDSIYLHYMKYYTLYRVIKDSNNEVIDYKLVKQYDKREDIQRELKASSKTINNIIYKSFDHYEKRKKDFQNYILISDKITLEEVTA